MFESMSQVNSVRDYGLCPDCLSVDVARFVVRFDCEAGHSDCFSVECSSLSCDFWETNCYGGE